VAIATSCLVAVCARAQELREVDLSADVITSDVVDGRRVNRLTGNIVLIEDSTVLRAERATEYVAQDLVVFVGDVSIVEAETDTLTTDVLRYERGQKIGAASGRVVLSDGDVNVRGPVAQYRVDERYTWFEDGVTLRDSVATLTAVRGEYWSREKRALFHEEVRLVRDRSVTTADSIEYFRETEMADARGAVAIVDTADADAGQEPDVSFLFAARVRALRSNNDASAEGDVLLLRVVGDTTGAEPDTLALRAGRLSSIETDSVQVLTAAGGVTVWRSTISARSDSLTMIRTTRDGVTSESVTFFGDPVLWRDMAQISGERIRAVIRDGSVDSLFVDGDAFLAQEDTLAAAIQQVEGQRLRGWFADESGAITVGPDARAIQFLERDGEAAGAVRLAASTVTFFLAGDSLQTVRAAEDVDGTYYDEEIVPAGLALDGLNWRPEDRPTRALFAADARARDVVARR